MEKINILYVDDEINNLHAFRAKFRHHYNILTALSPAEATMLLNENPDTHIIISDQRMPDKTGVEFLESIIKTHPDPIRILLTGYSDITAVIDAINKGQVFRYIEKPWEDHEMKMTIENAYQIYFINKQLKIKQQELQKLNEELNRFVYSASHDLKAPVKSMLGILKLAEAEGKKDNHLMELIEESAKKLDYFIGNITDYYKNIRFEKNLNAIDFNKIIQESIDTVNHVQNTPVDEINFDISIEQTVPFINDEFRLSVIISYLLSNAIKYQKKEEQNKNVTIKIITDERLARIALTDNGIGIPARYKDYIFNMFFRATTQSTGSGIGLYIVKETIQRLEGTIKVDSKEGKGSTFEIVIPNETIHSAIAKIKNPVS